MYEPYWRLDVKPFENFSDDSFYYPGEAHQGTLLKLRYAIENRRGIAVVSGAAGLGKSLLVRTLFRQLPDEYQPRAHLVFPQLSPTSLLAYLADELDSSSASDQSTDASCQLRRLERCLAENSQRGQHTVIAIDEAHLLHEYAGLETIRLLTNFETDGRPDWTILLVGQPQLLTQLDRAPGLDERMGVKCLLRPLQLEETISYVSHKLTAAGASQMIFTGDALEAVHEHSRGVPRRINRLCDLALLIGFAEELPEIGAAQIEAVADELVTITPE
ncbi:MAG: AAA family ATPase [Pirellulaceae bacterium]|nr:AAA family ATPase [Planctomycetales bacterium]